MTACGQPEPVHVSTATETAATAASEKPQSAVDAQDAGALVEAMAAAGVPIKLIKVYTEEDDPNELLGRPGGYVAKSAFSDSRVKASAVKGTGADAIERGGSIEVYADRAGAVKRGEYIQTMTQAMQGLAGREYDYVTGGVLVRVTASLTPTQAKTYQAAISKIIGADAVLVEAPSAKSPS